MHAFRQLTVWQKAHELALATHRAVDAAPARRHHALAAQLRRAATSIPMLIAEGAGRATAEEFVHGLGLAIAAVHEADYLLLLAAELAVITPSEHAKLEARGDEVVRMLVGLRGTVQKRVPRRELRRKVTRS